jgi:hypothetical protein
VVLALSLLTGCSGAVGEPQSGSTIDSEESASAHRTIVVQNEDGTSPVRHLDIPMSEHLRDVEIRTLLRKASIRRPSIGTYSCAGSSMWLFNGPNLSGDE